MNVYRTRQVSSTSSSSTSESNWTNSHLDQVDQNLFWQEDNPLDQEAIARVVNNLAEDMANQVGLGPEGQGAAGEAPPPYPGPGNPQPNGPNAAELLGLVQGLITAQQQQHQAAIEADNRFQNAHRELGQQIENLTHAIGAGGGGRPHHGGAHFKPSMFRPLDMKATTKENKLLSEEFVNWTLSIKRVLQANPGVAALPIQRLTALILAGIGEKAERRLTGLGQNPTFESLEEFFDRLKAIFCSSTVQTDAEEQFHKAKQYTSEDLNSWHARCLLYFRLAFPVQEYWNLCLKKYFEGMNNKKLAQKTVELYIMQRPGGWEALCNNNGYDHCLSLTLKCQAQEAFIGHLFADNSRTSTKISQDAPVPMDTSAIQSRNDTRNRRGAVPRARTTNNVNPTGQGQRSNPPGGMQKKLNERARSQGTQPRAPPSLARDRSKPWALDGKDKSNDTCHRCNQTGHWANECTQVQGQKRTWSEVVAGGSNNGGTIGTVLPSATASAERPVLLPKN